MHAPTLLLAPEGGGLEAAARLLGAPLRKLAVVERVQRAQLVVQRQVLRGAHLALHNTFSMSGCLPSAASTETQLQGSAVSGGAALPACEKPLIARSWEPLQCNRMTQCSIKCCIAPFVSQGASMRLKNSACARALQCARAEGSCAPPSAALALLAVPPPALLLVCWGWPARQVAASTSIGTRTAQAHSQTPRPRST